MTKWKLVCSECDCQVQSGALAGVCPECGLPLLVKYDRLPDASARSALGDRPWTMWRYTEFLPLADGEVPVSLGEGATPLVRLVALEDELELERVWVKDESQNPTGSFKARGMAAAVTRAKYEGAPSLVVPTAGNAGVALAAYGASCSLPTKVFAPVATPPRILEQIRMFGADLELIEGHIGDCGKAARQFASTTGAFDVSTLREPYRIEGKKTLGLELAEQLGWELPDSIVYPTGGGTGLIGMWKAFAELAECKWIGSNEVKLHSVQSTGCAPVQRAMSEHADEVSAWKNPQTVAAGLRVPAPLGGRLMLRALRDSGGTALAVTDADLVKEQRYLGKKGIDAAPEGGATVAALRHLVSSGGVSKGEKVVLFNTGAGWLYET